MKLGEKNTENINRDFWFLRDNGVRALTAIYMVGKAYKEDVVIVGLPRRKIHRKTGT